MSAVIDGKVPADRMRDDVRCRSDRGLAAGSAVGQIDDPSDLALPAGLNPECAVAQGAGTGGAKNKG
jgi:hypothetical protein